MKTTELRPGQHGAITNIYGRFGFNKTTAIELPTRYGKSDVIRLSALRMFVNQLVSGSIVMSPSEYLRDQIVRKDKIQDMEARYAISGCNPFDVISPQSLIRPFSSGAYLASITTQLATYNMDVIFDLTKTFRDIGKPLAFFIDECHEFCEDKTRGKLVQGLIDCGAYVVLLTATANRADGGTIPGFRYEVTEERDRSITQNRIIEIDAEVKVETAFYKQRVAKCRLIPDYKYSFRDAWGENPATICKLNRVLIDCDVTTNSGTKRLSEMTASELGGTLGSNVRDPAVIDKCCHEFVTRLVAARRSREEIVGIVYSCNDMLGKNNEHAQSIKESILRQCEFMRFKPMRIGIVTMKSEEAGNHDAANQIRDFVLGKSYDVLIVKQMGGAGLDCGPLKIELDLSDYRTPSSCIQRWMRVATPYKQLRVGTVILPHDVLSINIWNEFVHDQGGDTTITLSSELERVTTKDIEESDDQQMLSFENPHVSQIDDTDGHISDVSNTDQVNLLKEKLPKLSELYTDAELSNALLESSGMASGVSRETTGEQCRRYRSECFGADGKSGMLRQIVNLMMKRNGEQYNGERFGKLAARVGERAKRQAGCAGVDVDDIHGLREWSAIWTYLERQRRMLMEKPNRKVA